MMKRKGIKGKIWTFFSWCIRRREDAVYTVEATWIMGISLCLLLAIILLGYHVYAEVFCYASETFEEVEPVALFRAHEMINDALGR